MSVVAPHGPGRVPAQPAGPRSHARTHARPQQSHRAVIGEALDNRKLPRRVRYEVRDGVAVVAFSAASSTMAAMAFGFLLSRVG